MIDLETRLRRQSLKRELREINREEKAKKPPRARPKRERRDTHKIEGAPGEGTERKAVPAAWRVAIRARQDERCAACGEPFAAGVAREYDHINPIALGGAHAESNIQALCPPCHRVKTALDVGRIAKAKRIAKKHFEPRKPSRMRSRGFG